MSGSSKKYYLNSFIWGAGSKILDAGFKFITIPLLLVYFGKDNYGLLTLAIATNAYMQLLNMGTNTGAVKFFSQWIASGNHELMNRVTRTSITFYLAIGFINSSILISLAFWGNSIFQVTKEQFQIFQTLLYILAGISIFNWVTFVFNQLLIANENIKITQQTLFAKAILNVCLVLATIHLELSIYTYFLYFTILNASVLIPYYIVCKKKELLNSIIPAFYWKDFSIVFRYSLAIFAMGLFSYTATQSRPLILGAFSTQGVSILSEYRVIEVFPLFIISIGGLLISILLPKTSKALQNNDKEQIEKIAYTGTRYTSILISILCIPVILNSKEILTMYIGLEYIFLSQWLALWIFTLILQFHNSPVASLVLATGKTRVLVYSTAFACIVSIIINAVLCNTFGVGSAVIGYFVYIIIQNMFYYLYFNTKILNLNSLHIFKAFIIPTLIGISSATIVHFADIQIGETKLELLVQLILKAGMWLVLFGGAVLGFKVVDKETIKSLFKA